MAEKFSLSKDNIVKNGFVGFSWTVLFFGFIPPLCRGDWKYGAIIFIAACITFGISSIVFAFMYNKIYTRDLLEQGYMPVDEDIKSLLVRNNLMRRDA